jgi:hypothetical protein
MMGFKKQFTNKSIGIILSLFMVFGLIFLIFKFLTFLNNNHREIVMKDTISILGKIETIRTYKTKSFEIAYYSQNRKYHIHPSITTSTYKKYKQGDTISLFVSKKYPEMAIIKY